MGEARSGGRHFLVGSIVEVLEKDAGVRLVCTVVPPPRNIEPENEGKLYVRDRALSARRGRSGCLYEFVDVSSVRPTPPPHKASKRFELNDVVEAYYIGGWWEGVVTAVSDGGERFVVTFENPPEPDELRFPPSSLRPLWDWVDGVWTWPQRKGENGALKVKMDEYIVLFEHADSTKQLNRSELRPHLEWKDGKWLIHHDGAASSSATKSKGKENRQLIDEDDSRAPNEERRHIDEDGDDVENDRNVQQLIDEEDSRAPNEETELIDEDGDDIEYDRDVQQVIDEYSISSASNEDSEQTLPL
ncbi:hypothetical protein SASPL_147186 [Salvia splendens]|uniref:Agenet domain-containing protein n=1 Tax=Salvia splendens TaxID=180675 RepID=A0A8X8Z6E5_SALSN|nr:hypothetical protein SASPL_147186 [Salvia splendens]